MNDNINFKGKINCASDIVADGNMLALSARQLVMDLQGHTISCNRPCLFELSYGSELVLQNGSIYAPRISETASDTEYKFKIFNARLLMKDIYLDCDGSRSKSQWNYRIFNLGQSYDEMTSDVGRSYVEFDKSCRINMHDCDNGEHLIVSISPYSSVSSAYQALSTNTDFFEKYPTQRDYEKAIMPTVTTYADVKILRSLSADEETSYPGFIGGTGSDWFETIVNIENEARIFAQGHGLYLGNNGVININGSATVIGGTGICMRSGMLNIKRDANPTIIGVGDRTSVYTPLHTLNHNSDFGSNLHLGHAVCLEDNGTSYGGKRVSADIQSGRFISYNNTAIGSYGIGTVLSSKLGYPVAEAETRPVSAWAYLEKGSYVGRTGTYSFLSTDFTTPLSAGDVLKEYTLYYCKRPENFIDGAQLDRRESQIPYDYETGANPDYRTAKNPEIPSINAVKFENGVSVDLSDIKGLLKAMKDVLILLGVKESNISGYTEQYYGF